MNEEFLAANFANCANEAVDANSKMNSVIQFA